MGTIDTSALLVENYSEKDDRLLLLDGAHLNEGNKFIFFSGEEDLKATIAQKVLS